ncbi:hypothetical protein [Roseibium alexandrii]|uniref:hypothetical protein n=1 Tax=Roseibium alexandrii TaxID=388408 RepID=UPI0039945ABC
MEHIEIAVATLFRSIVAIGVPGERIFVLYVFSTLAIVYVVYRFRKPTVAFLKYCFPKDIYLHPSAKQDYLYYFWMALLKGVLVAVPLAWLGTSIHGIWVEPATLQAGEATDHSFLVHSCFFLSAPAGLRFCSFFHALPAAQGPDPLGVPQGSSLCRGVDAAYSFPDVAR